MPPLGNLLLLRHVYSACVVTIILSLCNWQTSLDRIGLSKGNERRNLRLKPEEIAPGSPGESSPTSPGINPVGTGSGLLDDIDVPRQTRRPKRGQQVDDEHDVELDDGETKVDETVAQEELKEIIRNWLGENPRPEYDTKLTKDEKIQRYKEYDTYFLDEIEELDNFQMWYTEGHERLYEYFGHGTHSQRKRLIPGLHWGKDAEIDAQIFQASTAEERVLILKEFEKRDDADRIMQHKSPRSESESYPWHTRATDGDIDSCPIVTPNDGTADSTDKFFYMQGMRNMFTKLFKLLGEDGEEVGFFNLTPGQKRSSAGQRALFNLDSRNYTVQDRCHTAHLLPFASAH